MSLESKLVKIFDDVPQTEKARAIFDTFLEGVKRGNIVAFWEVNTIRFKHQLHVTREELKNALTVEELEQENEKIIRQINSRFN